jgi:hypothetical protein
VNPGKSFRWVGGDILSNVKICHFAKNISDQQKIRLGMIEESSGSNINSTFHF